MTIHVLKTWGKPGEAATTVCRRVGRQVEGKEDVYWGPSGTFRAVLPSNTHQGPTCKDCRLSAHAKKTDKTNMRLP